MTKTYACLVEGIASSVFHVKDRMNAVARNDRGGPRIVSRAHAAADFRRCRGFARSNRSIRFQLIERAIS